MIKQFLFSAGAGILLLAACSAPEGPAVRAHVVSRKRMAGDTLRVHYEYAWEGRTYADSMQFPGKTLVPHDSIPVEIIPGKPPQSRLVLP